MFGIDWNLDGKIDLVDDFLTLSLLEDEQDLDCEDMTEESNEDSEGE